MVCASTGHGQSDPFVMGTLGDSISAGFNADRLGDNRHLNWSTGTQINSHLAKISNLRREKVEAYNEAIVGSHSHHLDRQVNRLLKHNPDYVTITVGANDVCHWSEEFEPERQVFESEVRDTLARLVESNQHVKIFLAPIPDMVRLREVAHQKPFCQQRWDLLNICPMLLNSSLSDIQRQRFAGRLEAANDTLASLSKEFQDHVFFEADLTQFQFKWEQVSRLDCFHPNTSGQNLFSELTWSLMQSEEFSPDSE
jgi:lysophospholipase L1-like esterase